MLGTFIRLEILITMEQLKKIMPGRESMVLIAALLGFGLASLLAIPILYSCCFI